jgi:hypothetical protein
MLVDAQDIQSNSTTAELIKPKRALLKRFMIGTIIIAVVVLMIVWIIFLGWIAAQLGAAFVSILASVF